MIDIRLKCICTPEEVTLNVRERKFNEDIKDWMEFVTKQVTHWHQTEHPLCRSDKLEYLKIPVPDGSPQIGTKPK